MKFLLIRHGQTAGNREGRYIGCRTDEALCEEGKKVLYEKSRPFADGVFSSPMKRCMETAEILFPNRSIRIVDGLTECDFGAFENKNYGELNGRADYQAWIDSGGEAQFPGGESRAQFAERCVRAFKECVSGLEEGIYAFVVHGGTIMALMEYLTDKPGSYFDFRAANGEGYAVDDRGGYEPIRLL